MSCSLGCCWVSVEAMVSKSEKDGGLDDKSSKVSILGVGDVGGV